MKKIYLLSAFFLLSTFGQAHSTPTYTTGVSPAISSYPAGVVDTGTFLPNYIGGTTGSAVGGTNLDTSRVYFYDSTVSTDNPATADPFNLLVWRFDSAKDSLRLYPHQDHLSGLADTAFEAQDVMEYSVFGCNGLVGACKTEAEWTILSDVIAFADYAGGSPTYTFTGTEPSTIYRGGSAEFGAINAYTRDYNFGTAYNFYGMRSSTISMIANDADPELDAVIAFNERDVNPVPEPGTFLLLGLGLGIIIKLKSKVKAEKI